jgi:hypothetical protein
LDLEAQILQEHSRANCDIIVNWIGSSQKRFDQLFHLFLHGESLVTQRAAWPVSYAVGKHPHFIHKHFSSLLDNLSRPGIHNAIRRNTMRLLQDITIPEQYQGQVMDISFNYIIDPREKVAVKAFSLTVLGNMLQQYPEIGPEIKLVIEDQWNNQTAAFYSRAKKLLHQLDKKK